MVSNIKSPSSRGAMTAKAIGDLLFTDDIDVPEYAEYAYEADDEHMSEGEAMARYKNAKRLYPDAIVNLEEMPCGHYAVNVLKTDWQKQTFYRHSYKTLVRRALERIFG